MSGSSEANRQKTEHELSALRSLSPGSVHELRSRWINTVEQFVSAGATEQGREGLKNLLTDTQVTIDALLQEAREIIGAEQYDALTQAKPGGPLGARFDDPKGGAS